MIRSGRVQLGGEFRAATIGELINMHSQFQSMLFRGCQNTPALIDIEIATLVKDIAIFRQFFTCHARHHLLDDLRQIAVAVVRDVPAVQVHVRQPVRGVA